MEEMTINIKNLIWHVVKQWKVILIVSMAVASLGAMVKVNTYREILSDENKKVNFERQNFEKIKEYTEEKNSLEEQIVALNNEHKMLEQYMDDSLLMNIDPLNCVETSIEIYIDSKYEIMPDKSIQNPDQIGKILKSYSTRLELGSLYEDINEQLQYNKELKYLKEIIKYTTNSSTGYITFNIKTNSVEESIAIGNLAVAFIERLYDQINNEIAPHEIIVYPIKTDSIIDDSLSQHQQNKELRLLTLNNQLEVAQNTLLYLKEPAEKNLGVGYWIDSLTMIGLCGLVSAVVTVGYIAVMALLFKVQDEEFIANEYSLLVLGKQPDFTPKKNIIDKIIYKKSNDSLFKNQQAFYEYMIANVKRLISLEEKIHITGTIDIDLIERVAKEIENNVKVQVTYGQYVLESKESLEQTMNADFVILVEKMFDTSNTKLDKEIKYINRLNKEIKGILLL